MNFTPLEWANLSPSENSPQLSNIGCGTANLLSKTTNPTAIINPDRTTTSCPPALPSSSTISVDCHPRYQRRLPTNHNFRTSIPWSHDMNNTTIRILITSLQNDFPRLQRSNEIIFVLMLVSPQPHKITILIPNSTAITISFPSHIHLEIITHPLQKVKPKKITSLIRWNQIRPNKGSKGAVSQNMNKSLFNITTMMTILICMSSFDLQIYAPSFASPILPIMSPFHSHWGHLIGQTNFWTEELNTLNSEYNLVF